MTIGSTLPADLLQSVQRLFDEVDQRFKAELAAAEIAATLRIDQHRAENEAMRDELAERSKESRSLEAALADTRSRLADLEEDLRATRSELKERETAQHFLELRMSERSSEVDNLRQQVTLAHRQFDHFQAASQARLDEERIVNEGKLAAALRANEQIRSDLNYAERQLAASDGQLQQVALSREQLNSVHIRLQSTFDDLRQENVKQAESIRTLELEVAQRTATLATLQHTHDQTVTKLVETETHLAVSVSKVAMLKVSLAACERRAEVAQREHLVLLRREAELESALGQCQSKLRSVS